MNAIGTEALIGAYISVPLATGGQSTIRGSPALIHEPHFATLLLFIRLHISSHIVAIESVSD